MTTTDMTSPHPQSHIILIWPKETNRFFLLEDNITRKYKTKTMTEHAHEYIFSLSPAELAWSQANSCVNLTGVVQ
jgi:hypothetical protein